MPDEIKQRLEDSAAQCVKSYEGWASNKKDSGARAALQEAVHELRKVASRLEIELAVSDRNQSQKPMPIPQNRNAKGAQKPNEGKDGNQSGEGKDQEVKKVKLPPRKTEAKQESKDAPKESSSE